MIKVIYSTYSKLLDKTFTDEKIVRNIEDFHLFALSLNLNYQIIEIKEV